jgi:hypothetical protein
LTSETFVGTASNACPSTIREKKVKEKRQKMEERKK